MKHHQFCLLLGTIWVAPVVGPDWNTNLIASAFFLIIGALMAVTEISK